MNRFNILLGKKSEKENNSVLRWPKKSNHDGPYLSRLECQAKYTDFDGNWYINKPEFFSETIRKEFDKFRGS